MDDEDATVCVVSAPRAVVEETPARREARRVAEPELIRKAKEEERGEEESRRSSLHSLDGSAHPGTHRRRSDADRRDR